jgi:hypothetical protein
VLKAIRVACRWSGQRGAGDLRFASGQAGWPSVLNLLANIDDYVFGHVLRAGELQARAATAGPAHAAAITGYIHGQLATGQFPHLSKLTRDPAAQAIADPGQLDQRFERGLRALLDGAAAD